MDVIHGQILSWNFSVSLPGRAWEMSYRRVDCRDSSRETLAMHELSLAESLIDLIEDEARRSGFTRVRTVRLEIGTLAGVEPDALRFGFEVAAQNTCAEGAQLDILAPPGEAWCFQCERTVEIAAYHDGCPHCASHRLQVTQGTQFQLKELEVV